LAGFELLLTGSYSCLGDLLYWQAKAKPIFKPTPENGENEIGISKISSKYWPETDCILISQLATYFTE